VLKPTDPNYHSTRHAQSIIGLKERIQAVQPTLDLGNVVEPVVSTEAHVHSVELYKLTALVYLERVSQNFSGLSEQINAYVAKAFEILAEMKTCDLPIPLFIFGCEARTEESRMTILDLLEEPENVTHSRSLEGVRRMVQAIWVQDDLEIENELDYVMKLDTVITSNYIIPPFA
jgi:hypothetical protein